ncbi:SIR2 family NAD-dependent protein deacylase [Cohaesibacter celericrescens]|uniref:protein acetyllysine N-acetyltransferase n=1 Tax=Cohaesibacter celericrescens TaxID=2067669 RepID=A0A2N5XW03_9HYPH|nr:Sir2 family NAD-dependent protein deacetylase [Cohaesibacter celericrescens]PLW78608.1 NAD-dependent deacetylase [Cohaesibacter celericrescens]
MDYNSQHSARTTLCSMVNNASNITIFTGAGISTESGIPDFRSPTGLWSKMVPIQFDEFVSSETARLEDWRRRFIMNREFSAAKPNEGHKALLRLNRSGKLAGTITQNIDGLHQKSGLPADQVIEIHGNSTYGACLSCSAKSSLLEAERVIAETGKAPRCSLCGGLIKAATISFGQPMPEPELLRAAQLAKSCDLFIVLGSSLVVYPAADLPQIAKQNGAELVIINREPTPLNQMADLYIRDEIGSVMQSIL